MYTHTFTFTKLNNYCIISKCTRVCFNKKKKLVKGSSSANSCPRDIYLVFYLLKPEQNNAKGGPKLVAGRSSPNHEASTSIWTAWMVKGLITVCAACGTVSSCFLHPSKVSKLRVL